MNEVEDTQGNDVPPYLSPTTFSNFLDAHRRTLPTRIDRSIMGNVAGGDQVRILKALRFFDLTDDEGRPTPAFASMGDLDEDGLKTMWGKLLRRAYPYLFEGFSLEKATQSQIEERFRETGIKGDTVRKAVAFFIGLAKNAGLNLSPYFKSMKRRGPSGPRTVRRTLTRRGTVKVTTVDATDTGTRVGSTTSSAKTIRFKSGGTAELRVDVDVVSLSREDRDALFGWIDSMTTYEKQSGAADFDSADPTQ